MRFLLCFYLLLFPFFSNASATPTATPKMKVQLQVRHIEAERWLFEYEFERPISRIDLGPARGNFRSSAWSILGDQVQLKREGRFEFLDGGGNRFSRLQLELRKYNDFPEGAYSPMNLFSDGGVAIYLKNFLGTILLDTQEYDMDLQLTLHGLDNETTIAPSAHQTSFYLYFGPVQAQSLLGHLAVIDPATPTWVREVIDTNYPKLLEVYSKKFTKPIGNMSFLLAVSPNKGESFSLKGGAIENQIAIRFAGTNIYQDSPRARSMLQQLLAHELVHIWQQDVVGGGGNPNERWIHEGGAELLASAGLRAANLWSEEQLQSFIQATLSECAKLAGDLKSYRGGYACGFKRQYELGVAPFDLWNALIQSANQSQTMYSEIMLNNVLRDKFGMTTQSH